MPPGGCTAPRAPARRHPSPPRLPRPSTRRARRLPAAPRDGAAAPALPPGYFSINGPTPPGYEWGVPPPPPPPDPNAPKPYVPVVSPPPPPLFPTQ
ncbi:hypothetical protein H7H73_24915 [Mycobacterium rufum]|uniref:Uncharacterized protein n=1 Tax=Mycolicibacterium rufum TaxID=318424 RepID=A0A9X3BR12_9MYCO|nr:hypothetical protein [Mycolicibacterium rufum]